MTATRRDRVAGILDRLRPGVAAVRARVQGLDGVPWPSEDSREDAALLARSAQRLGEVLEACRARLVEGLGQDPEAAQRQIHHDMRSRASATLGCAQLLLEKGGGLPPAARPVLADVVAGAEHLLADIEQLSPRYHGPAPGDPAPGPGDASPPPREDPGA